MNLIDEATYIKIGLEMTYEVFKRLTWNQKKEIFGTDCMQNKIYELPKVIECLDKYLKLQASLNEAIDNSFEKPIQILTDSDGFETEVK